jgi:hypothetical protein
MFFPAKSERPRLVLRQVTGAADDPMKQGARQGSRLTFRKESEWQVL